MCFSDNDRASQTHLMKCTKDFLIHHITSREHNQLRADGYESNMKIYQVSEQGFATLQMFCLKRTSDALFF